MPDPDNTQINTNVSQTTQTPAPVAPAGIINPDGTFVTGWEQKYPEADRPTLSRFKKFDDFVNSSMDGRRKLGRNPEDMVVIPKDDSPDEVKQAFRKARGLPESFDKYEYKPDEKLNKVAPIIPERLDKFKKFAHEKLGLNPNEFKELLTYYHQDIVDAKGQRDNDEIEWLEQNRITGIGILKKEFGNGLEQRTLRAEGMVDKYGGKVIKDTDGIERTLIEKLEQEIPAIKTSPYWRMIWDNVAESLSEDTLKGVSKITAPTTSDIDSKIAEKRQHPAYMNKAHPEHQQIIKDIDYLYKQKKTA